MDYTILYDFTLTNSDFVQPIILEWFNELFRFVKEEANIALEVDDSMEIREMGIHFHVKYAGPLGGQNGTKKIKVDISNDEILVFKPVLMPAITYYSDLSNHSLLLFFHPAGFCCKNTIQLSLKHITNNFPPSDYKP